MEKTIQLNNNLSSYEQKILVEMINYHEALYKEDLIEPKNKYVSLKGYKSIFGSPAYTFEFWGADTLEEAIKLESIENSILRDIQDKYSLATSIQELEQEIRSSYTQENVQEFISESVQEIRYKFELLQKQRANRKKIVINLEDLEEIAA